jgi:hypothetical protein
MIGVRSLRWNNRYLWFGILALLALMGLMIFGAPAANRLESGSTWSRSPAGYSAWYASLIDQGVDIQRWQRPVSDLLEQLGNGAPDSTTTTLIQHSEATEATMVVVLPGFWDMSNVSSTLPWLSDWVGAGHQLILLGLRQPATAATFSKTITSDFGAIQLDTRRRHPADLSAADTFLKDEYGTLIWREIWEFQPQGGIPDTGEVVFVATPFLAANAYLNAPGNFSLLTDLVTRNGGSVWVDEYLHGYRDAEAITTELGSDNFLAYLARTPLTVFTLQAIAMLLLALLALNHRLGQRLTLQEPAVDNSRAYIEALSGVLHKSNSHDFVVHTITQAERARLQKALGLGTTPVTNDQLITSWQQQTGGTAADLAPLLQTRPPRNDEQIKAWLKQLQSVHQFTLTRTSAHE